MTTIIVQIKDNMDPLKDPDVAWDIRGPANHKEAAHALTRVSAALLSQYLQAEKAAELKKLASARLSNGIGA